MPLVAQLLPLPGWLVSVPLVAQLLPLPLPLPLPAWLVSVPLGWQGFAGGVGWQGFPGGVLSVPAGGQVCPGGVVSVAGGVGVGVVVCCVTDQLILPWISAVTSLLEPMMMVWPWGPPATASLVISNLPA